MSGPLSDKKLKEVQSKYNMISPFVDHKCRELGPSYGLSSAGYDCSLGNKIWIAKPSSGIVDVKSLPLAKDLFDEHEGDSFVIMPGMFVLGSTREHFKIPNHIIGKCYDKSTHRRLGKVSGATPLEPGWHGHLVIELNFLAPWPIRIHSGMGVCQIIFEEIEGKVETPYGNNKYQGQTGITGAL